MENVKTWQHGPFFHSCQSSFLLFLKNIDKQIVLLGPLHLHHYSWSSNPSIPHFPSVYPNIRHCCLLPARICFMNLSIITCYLTQFHVLLNTMAVILTGKEGSLSRLLFVEAIYLIEMSGEWRGSSFLSNFLEKNITKHPGFSQLCNVIRWITQSVVREERNFTIKI